MLVKVKSRESLRFSSYLMYYIYVTSGSSLLIESTNSMISSKQILKRMMSYNIIFTIWLKDNLNADCPSELNADDLSELNADHA